MGNLRYVTLTGVDDHTDFAELKRLSVDWHFVEWAVLYDPARAGKGGRYPSLEWLEGFASRAHEAGLTIALHLCGKAVKLLLNSVEPAAITEPGAARLFALAAYFGRVQLNTRAKLADAGLFRALITQLSRNENRTQVVLQWFPFNEALCESLWSESSFEVLVDSSGGRGVERTDWPSLERQNLRRVGYAGGLGPENIVKHLGAMSLAASGRPFWVDMETRLRNEVDEFEVAKAERILELVGAFVQEQEQIAGSVFGTGTQEVANLEGLWLDWWVGCARNKDLVVPPLDARRAMTLYRPTGTYQSYEPSQDKALAVRVLSAERIALTPTEDGGWKAQAMSVDALEMTAEDLHIAGLRAVVAKHFGRKVPLNPSDI